MYEIQIETKDGWHNLLAFGNYEEIEGLGEILSVDGLPDGTDLESDFDALKAYDGMNDLAQKIVLAYYKATDNFDPDEALEAYAGNYTNGQPLSPDEEELIETVMRDRLYRYGLTQDGCIIEHI